MCAESYESWLTVDKVIAVITRPTFWPAVYRMQNTRPTGVLYLGLSTRQSAS